MPFGGFKDFSDCISKIQSQGKDIDSAKKICGAIKTKTEGKMKDWRILNFYVPFVTESYKTEEKSGFRIKGVAISETVTRNRVKYSGEELEKSATSLIGKPVLKDHNNSVDAIIGKVTNAYYDKSERNLKFEANITDKSISEKMAEGLISNVSVGAYVRDMNKKEDSDIIEAKGIDFVEISAVAVPADPQAGLTSFDMALDNAILLKESYDGNYDNTDSKEDLEDEEMVDTNIKEAVHVDEKEKCPECGKMIPKGEMKLHMKDMHSEKEEKMGEEIKTEVQTQTQPQINVNVDTSKFENLLAEMQKKVDSLTEQLNKKEEKKEEVKEDLTKGKVLQEAQDSKSNDFNYIMESPRRVTIHMTSEALAEKYSNLKAR